MATFLSFITWSRNLKRVQRMRQLERALSDLYSKINMHQSIYHQSAKKIDAIKNYYMRHHGEEYSLILDEDLEYVRVCERMETSRRRLESLKKERAELRKKIQDMMHRI